MKSSPELETLITQIVETRKLATLELGDHDWRTRPGMESAKARAQNDLVGLNQKLLEAFTKTVFKVFINGPVASVEKLAARVDKEISVITVKSLYEEIATVVQPMLSMGGNFQSDAYLRMLEIVGAYARAQNIYPEGPLKEPIGVGVQNLEQLVDIVRNFVREAFGDRLYTSYTTNIAANLFLSKQEPTPITALILTGVSASEKGVVSETLFPGQPTFTLELAQDEEVTQSTTAKVITKILHTYHKLNPKKVENNE